VFPRKAWEEQVVVSADTFYLLKLERKNHKTSASHGENQRAPSRNQVPNLLKAYTLSNSAHDAIMKDELSHKISAAIVAAWLEDRARVESAVGPWSPCRTVFPKWRIRALLGL